MNVASRSILLFLGGAAIGATAAILAAPTSGRETRRKLKQASVDLAHRASALQEACRKATVAGKEAFLQTMNGSSMKSETTGIPHH